MIIVVVMVIIIFLINIMLLKLLNMKTDKRTAENCDYNFHRCLITSSAVKIP